MTGLEVVLSDGTVVELDGDAPGYDLLGAFVGSEGTLGVATRIRLRVIPVPESVRTLVAFFPDTVDGRRRGQRDRRRRDRPGRDRADGPALDQGRRGRPPAPASGSMPALRCCVELDGPREECEALIERHRGAVRERRGVRGAARRATSRSGR